LKWNAIGQPATKNMILVMSLGDKKKSYHNTKCYNYAFKWFVKIEITADKNYSQMGTF